VPRGRGESAARYGLSFWAWAVAAAFRSVLASEAAMPLEARSCSIVAMSCDCSASLRPDEPLPKGDRLLVAIRSGSAEASSAGVEVVEAAGTPPEGEPEFAGLEAAGPGLWLEAAGSGLWLEAAGLGPWLAPQPAARARNARQKPVASVTRDRLVPRATRSTGHPSDRFI
jgi:hypothetical protein